MNINKKMCCWVGAIIFLLLIILVIEVGKNKCKQIPTLDKEISDDEYFWITVPSEENTNLDFDVNSIAKDDNTIYLYLSENMDFSNVIYYLRDGYNQYLKRMKSDFSNGEISLYGKRIIVVKSTIPSINIQVDNQYGTIYDVWADETKNTYCYGDMTITVPESIANQNQIPKNYVSMEADDARPGTVSLKGRGNATWSLATKKPYVLKLEKGLDLLGMGKDKSWVLLANSMDHSLIKAKMMFDLAEMCDIPYTPKMESVNLYINSVYQGVYLLGTKIEVNQDRINLEKDDFLINWGGSAPEQMITLQSDTLSINEEVSNQPYADLIFPELDANINEKKEIIQDIINKIEDVNSEDYLEYIDVDNWARYYWIQEISKNVDSTYRSVYSFYSKKNGKLYMGPIWDIDSSLGSNMVKNNIDFSQATGFEIRTQGLYVALFQHESFVEAVKNAYFEGGIRESMFKLAPAYENYQDQIQQAGELNLLIWPESGFYELDYGEGDYNQIYDSVISFYKERINWIDEQMSKDN